MRRYSLLLLLSLGATRGVAQKPAVDTGAIARWPTVGDPALSGDGQYFLYTVRHWGRWAAPELVVLRAMHGPWRRQLPGAQAWGLTRDSRRAVYLAPGDSLCLLPLGGTAATCTPHVTAFQLVPHGASEWLLYRRTTPARALVARELATGHERVFAAVTDYAVSPDGATLVLQSEAAQDSTTTRTLHWVRLAGGLPRTIWAASPGAPQRAGHFVFDSSSAQLAFTVEEGAGDAQGGPAVWYYQAGTAKAVVLTAGHAAGLERGWRLERGGYWGFSHDGRRLFVALKEPALPAPKPDAVQVDVWSYRDAKLQSQQLNELGPRSYAAVLQLTDRRLVRLQQEGEAFMLLRGALGDVAIVMHRQGDDGERNWNVAAQESLSLVSVTTGDRSRRLDGWASHVQSGGHYVHVVDPAGRDHFSYDRRTGRVTNLTAALPIPAVDPEADTPGDSHDLRGLQVAAWLEHEAAILIYDRYDIWQVDPSGQRPPLNLTNGYGRRHQIVFRLAGGEVPAEYRSQAIAKNATLLLTAFDRTTKQSGFYRLRLGRRGDPARLTMGPYTYELASAQPLTVRGAELYLVRRSSAAESPNYFTTADFKSFTPLTAVYPEAGYNWLRSELLTWQTFEGHSAQGALYKPENFDPNKKYPVILHYYEKKSDELNHYSPPGLTTGEINIPWFVSRGYLVFTPDIYYTVGETGRSAYNAIVSAAQHLSGFPWVDAARMGLQGHSFGGYETNYVVTQTPMFAAAMSASGPADLISSYGGLWGGNGWGGNGRGEYYELRRGGIGATLWQRPDLYIRNSPVFYADKVTTPLLMMNNKEDFNVSFAQGVEFFTALRRLGKRVWMLQYDGEGHGVSGAEAAKQHTIRVTQFFDHYLKGAPAPMWMTEGVPARRKGIDTGLELDPTGKTPGPGLLLDAVPGTTATRINRDSPRH